MIQDTDLNRLSTVYQSMWHMIKQFVAVPWFPSEYAVAQQPIKSWTLAYKSVSHTCLVRGRLGYMRSIAFTHPYQGHHCTVDRNLQS